MRVRVRGRVKFLRTPGSSTMRKDGCASAGPLCPPSDEKELLAASKHLMANYARAGLTLTAEEEAEALDAFKRFGITGLRKFYSGKASTRGVYREGSIDVVSKIVFSN